MSYEPVIEQLKYFPCVEGGLKTRYIQFWKQKAPFTLSSTIGDIGNL